MRKTIKNLIIGVLSVAAIAGCQKVPDLPYYDNGTTVTLTANKTAVTPTPADSISNVISFSWTNPEYKQDSSLYKYVLEIDSTGRNFAKESIKIVTGTLGTFLTGKELNAILLNYGFSLGVPYELDVRVTSSYGNNNESYKSNVLKISVTPYNDPSVLTTANTSVTCALATAAQLSNTFSWTKSFNGYSGNVTYLLQYDSASKNFVAPLEIPVGVNLFTKGLTEGEMNETALTSGIAGGTTGKVEYRVKATTAQGAVSYSNVVNVTIQSYVPILRFYMPGGYQGATGNGNNWDPGTAPEFIRDLRPAAMNKLYYMYIYLPANAEFKITQGRSWDINYGGSGGDLSGGGANLTVATAGYYRISIDRVNLKYDIREGRMGFVGGATGAGWTPANVFPNYALGTSAKNLFVGLTDFTTGGWKLIDHNDWNNGDITVLNARSYGSAGGSGSTLLINDANMPDIATTGRYRVIWDGRNVDNVKYEMSPATEMRVVGDGIQGVPAWNPGASPQMTYSGNGEWTITLTLVADKDIKFLAGNDWGAFDYEDNSGGSQATGTPRAIKWEGGSNFKTPTVTGSYTITLNEHTQTVTIN
ncbi:MAG: SusE domain-containing protein [Sphingobacteriales bacterium]|nr:SusE domain-containing protein [Sphingobacteriales bacterium]